MNLTYVILTGGQSSRFGSDKSDAILDGLTLLENIVTDLPLSSEVFISGPKKAELTRSLIFVEDEILNAGPVSGIRSTIGKVNSEFVALIATDIPCGAKVISQLWQSFQGQLSQVEAVIPKDATGFPQYLCGIYSTTALRRELSRLLTVDSCSMKKLIEEIYTFFVDFDNYNLLKDIDTQDDLKSYQLLLESKNG